MKYALSSGVLVKASHYRPEPSKDNVKFRCRECGKGAEFVPRNKRSEAYFRVRGHKGCLEAVSEAHLNRLKSGKKINLQSFLEAAKTAPIKSKPAQPNSRPSMGGSLLRALHELIFIDNRNPNIEFRRSVFTFDGRQVNSAEVFVDVAQVPDLKAYIGRPAIYYGISSSLVPSAKKDRIGIINLKGGLGVVFGRVRDQVNLRFDLMALDGLRADNQDFQICVIGIPVESNGSIYISLANQRQVFLNRVSRSRVRS